MKKKLLISMAFILLFCLSISSFAVTDMNNIKNSISNTTSAIGDTLVDSKDSIVNETKNITTHNSSIDNINENITSNSNYVAERTSNNYWLGFSYNTWLWLIFGTVGVIIVALVWYYGSQYEHSNYNN